VASRLVAGRITGPLSDLSDAAAAMAGGDYTQRVTPKRHDEIGRLGRVFNGMAAEIGASQERLESHVEQRTKELVAARCEADRANQAKSTFLSGMSHDLRTPLNAILGFAQLLEIDDHGAERAELARQILSGGRYLLELVDEVLDITRIESGQLSLSPEPVSVRDVVQRATELVRPLALERGIQLSVSLADQGDVVRADRQRLGQVLLNLLSNAVKYNRPQGQVRVTSERLPNDRYRILIADTGAGIPESKLALLFHPFERLGAEQTGIQGTGLGLALSRALAEAMGASVGVDSIVDQGSTFWVDLAQADPGVAVRPAPAASDLAKATTPATSGTILYVEDNASNIRLMERILRQRPGVELRHAANGEEGLAMIREARPDLVLLDMHLPDMTGDQILHRLWEDPVNRSLPIVVVTADATPGLSRRLKASGATACLTKPLNIKDVLDLFDSILVGVAEDRAS
jgi:signal transduction histidine kinase/CheY-like chemotaxis protein